MTPFHVINTLMTLRFTNNALFKISHKMLLILITFSAIWRRGLFKNLLKRVQKIEFAAASFVYGDT